MITMTWPQYLRGECRVNGFPVRLGPQQAEVLLILLLRYPGPVLRRELIDMLWPDPDREPRVPENTADAIVQRLGRSVGTYHIFSRKGFGFRLRQRPEDAGRGPNSTGLTAGAYQHDRRT